MKKFWFILLLPTSCLCQNFSHLYTKSYCGLDYTQANAVLGKKMKFFGLPFPGTDQPAPLVISGISSTSTIEKAFLWWDMTGTDTTQKVILENPLGIKDTLPGKLTGWYPSGAGCWGIGSNAFRADVTALISGNGSYFISGLPTDTTFTKSDVNGATLFIIYSDPTKKFNGKIIIYDGFMSVREDTLTPVISNMNAASNSTFATAFMQISDLQKENGSKISMNNGPYLAIDENFWDFEQKNSAVLAGQTTSIFGIIVPVDCCNLLMTGLYWRTNTDTTPPLISRSNDTLKCTSAAGYQWNVNDTPIINAVNKNLFVTEPGIYSVTIDNGAGCLIQSDTFDLKCLTQFTVPISHVGAQFSAETGYLSYQWFFENMLISGATSSTYLATDTGNYFLVVTNTFGCTYVSDTVYTDLTGIHEPGSGNYFLEVFPNPFRDDVSIKFSNEITGVSSIKISDLYGRNIITSPATPILNTGEGNLVSLKLKVGFLERGIYILEIKSAREVQTLRIMKW